MRGDSVKTAVATCKYIPGQCCIHGNPWRAVPITMCGFLANARDCIIMSTPPTMTAAGRKERGKDGGVRLHNGHTHHC